MKDTMKQIYIDCAAGLGLGNFTRLKTGPERAALVNKVADMYCDATDRGDELVRSQTISALMLLFWGEIAKMAEKCKAVSELDYDDFASQLYKCINVACEYRAWKTTNHSAEACIRSAIASRGAAAILYESNLDKNKANVNNYSLDAVIEDKDGHITSRIDLIEDADEDVRSLADDSPAARFIQSYLDKNKIIEAILFDNVAFDDCLKSVKETRRGIDYETGEEYTYTTSHAEFWAHKLKQNLINLPADYYDYFYTKYKVNGELLKLAIERISTTPSSKLSKLLNKTLTEARSFVSKLLVA